MAYKCVVANLGSQDPSAVTFTKTGNFPTEAQAWEEVIIGNDHFAKFKIHYRKSTFSGNELTGFEISDTKEDADFVPYDCFLDEDGNELEYILIGRYCISDTSVANSVDATVKTMTIGTGRSLCRAKGTGYQQMDAAMFNFWRDLALAVSEKVDFNSGQGVASYLGLARMDEGGWFIDGLAHVDSVYLYSNKPSKYVDSPTASTDGYSVLSYAMPTTNGCITKLGYDANHPTINYPSANNGSTSSYTTYYCDSSSYSSGNRLCSVNVGNASSTRGLFYLFGSNAWSPPGLIRLCYRPEYVPPAPSGGKTKFGTLTIVKKMFGNTEIVKEVLNGITIYEASTPPAPVVDPVLENNSWATIRQVCEAGEAGNYWSVGDTKTDVGTDGYTRTFRIVDMSGLYNKHVVFEQIELEGTNGSGATGVVWDADNVNDYLASDMNVTILPDVITRYSNELQNNLTDTTVKVTENGNSSTIVDVTNKLFLEAEKEVFGSATLSRSEEASALTQYAYYVTHNTAKDRKKYRAGAGSASAWWLRSPASGYSNFVCFITDSGSINGYYANYSRGFAPCFSF